MKGRPFDMLHGVLVLDKPAGMTSAAVVADVRRRIGAKTAGHTGTLDPMATGVLPICLGSATKLVQWLTADDKSYEVEIEFGLETDTYDRAGTVLRRDPKAGAAVESAALLAALATFTGEQQQLPPMYSAIKHGGVRLHDLARAGVDVELVARTVRIDRLELLELAPPRARLSITCSKGTFVRSLARDIGQLLGCGACVYRLRRTASGSFTLAGAVTLAAVDHPLAAAHLVSPAQAMGLPAVVVAAEEVRRVRDGRPLDPAVFASGIYDGLYQMLTSRGDVLAIAERRGERISLHRVLAHTADFVDVGSAGNVTSPRNDADLTVPPTLDG